MAKTKAVKLKAAGSLPKVQITIGHLQMYTFDLVLMGTGDTGATVVLTTDDIPPAHRTGRHEIVLPGPMNQLNDRMLSLAVIVISATGGDGELFAVDARILQDGQDAGEPCRHPEPGQSALLEGGMQGVTCRWFIKVV